MSFTETLQGKLQKWNVSVSFHEIHLSVLNVTPPLRRGLLVQFLYTMRAHSNHFSVAKSGLKD